MLFVGLLDLQFTTKVREEEYKGCNNKKQVF
jgi:hypothetical protein